MQRQGKFNWLLLSIIIVGAYLRFYHFSSMPFMYDEVSAWARTGFKSFHDLIENGVKGDGHPAGIQVFLNYWRMIFGDSEMSFKFPFLIMGILSIWLVYRIGNFWFNQTVGLLSAAFIATLQYTVMYSQIARPYSSGLFFSLMMVWCWTNYFFSDSTNAEESSSKNKKRWQLAGYIIFAALCCYNHYFSLLFAVIVASTGLFFLNRKNWKGYLIANAVVIILFLPHLSVTVHQFSIGGVGGWLAKPNHLFFQKYLNYVFEFSWWVKGAVLLLIAASFFYLDKKSRSKNKFRFISLLWFFLPALIGYFYSVYRNPVLQFSVLIFSFPFLLFFIFSAFRPLQPLLNVIVIFIAIAACSYALIFQRKHYDVFYHQPVEQFAKNSIQTVNELKEQKVATIIDEPSKYFGYYLNKYHSNIPVTYWPDLNMQSYPQFRKYLSSLDADAVVTGNVSNDYLMVVKQLFPYMIRRDEGFTYNFFCFSKNKNADSTINDVIWKDSLNFLHPQKFWRADSQNVKRDTITNSLYLPMNSEREFGPHFAAPVNQVANNRYNVVNISAQVSHVPPKCKAALVFSLKHRDSTIFYQEKPFYFFMDSTETSGIVFYSISLRDVDLDFKHAVLNAYIWNRYRETFDIDKIEIEVQQGNPIVYGLIEKIR